MTAAPSTAATPTDGERDEVSNLLVDYETQYDIDIDEREHLGDLIAQALADQRARYEAVADVMDRSSAVWTEAIEEADNDTDRGYATGRAHAAEQAALRIRAAIREAGVR